MPGSVLGMLGAGLMSWESVRGVGELCMLGPAHPRNAGMGGPSPCSNRGEQIPDGGSGEEESVKFTREILLKAEIAAVRSPPPMPLLLPSELSSGFWLG